MTIIRQATDEDASRLAELAERTFRNTFAYVNRAEDMDLHCRTHYRKEIQAAEIRDPDRTTLMCEVDGRLVGYAQLRWKNAPSCVAGSTPAEIQRLYVEHAWHGKGVAQALMDSLLSYAAAGEADVIWLGVWEENPRAISFYTKNGFSIVGNHVFVLGGDPQRDLVLAMNLLVRGPR
jgi:diamine N-acetyltransferase